MPPNSAAVIFIWVEWKSREITQKILSCINLQLTQELAKKHKKKAPKLFFSSFSLPPFIHSRIIYNNEKQFESSSSAKDVFGWVGKKAKGKSRKRFWNWKCYNWERRKRFSFAHKFTHFSSCDNFRSRKTKSFLQVYENEIFFFWRSSVSSCNSFFGTAAACLSRSERQKKESLIVEGKFSSLYFISHQHTHVGHIRMDGHGGKKAEHSTESRRRDSRKIRAYLRKRLTTHNTWKYV